MSSPALQILTRVEDRWLQILYLHDREIFSGIHLPSHDHTHHLRVWQFARELVMVWEESGRRFSMEEIELLILAVFFHDTGMSRTQQSRHGLVSREFCEAFLQENKLSAMAGKAELLDAIEQHDNKDYGLTHRDPTGLLTLLNLADDLDAFGMLGVYRYAEIYLMRGIPVVDIPGQVLSNLDSRYNHLESLLPTVSETFIRSCRDRFSVTRNFFKSASDHLIKENGNPAASCPQMKVLDEIAELVIRKKHHPVQLAADGLSSRDTRDWWLSFEHEWNQYKFSQP